MTLTRTKDGSFLYANPPAAVLLGTSVEGLLGRRASTLYEDPTDRGRLIETVRRYGEARDVEVRIRRPDGSSIWVSVHMRPFRLGDEEALCASFVDITDRRQQAARAERRVTRLLDRLDVGLFRSTLDLRLLESNEALRRILGLGPTLPTGMHLGTMLTDPRRFHDFEQAIERHGEVQDLEVEIGRPDGGRITALLSATIDRTPTGEDQLEGLLEDVTARRRMQAQVYQNQRLESVGRLAGGISHDFNNLLTAIVSFTSFAKESLPEDSSVRADLDEVLGASTRAAALVRQLLAFSRREVGVPRVVDVNEAVLSMHALLRRTLGADVELVSIPGPQVGKTRIDPTHLEQILMNLAVNARDAMPDGGKLIIETSNVELDDAYVAEHAGTVAGSYVMIAVTDTGVGISRELLTRIFEPFFTTKAAGRGTGLGLSTSYGLVRQSGGHIQVYSEVGRGTCLRVYLPRADADEDGRAGSERPSERPPSEGPLYGSECVLVVEDEPSVRRMLTRALRSHGYHVLAASHGEEALRELERASHVDLVVADVVMPRMGGLELADRLAETSPDSRFLLISGYTGQSVPASTITDRGHAFLQKPFSPDQLVRQVRTLLDSAVNRPADSEN